MRNFISVKPDLHMVTTIVQLACDRALQEGFQAVNISIANISCEV